MKIVIFNSKSFIDYFLLKLITPQLKNYIIFLIFISIKENFIVLIVLQFFIHKKVQ
jgi:hypothetical protein